MTATAKKTEKTEPSAYEHHRVFLPDLQKIGPWLLPRVMENYPDHTEGEIMTWLRGCCMSDIFLFVYTDHAVLLAQVQREALCRHPTVKEIFAFCDGKDGDVDEAAYLYSVMYQWAKGIGADEIQLENCTDVPRELIRSRLGKLYTNDAMYVPIE